MASPPRVAAILLPFAPRAQLAPSVLSNVLLPRRSMLPSRPRCAFWTDLGRHLGGRLWPSTTLQSRHSTFYLTSGRTADCTKDGAALRDWVNIIRGRPRRGVGVVSQGFVLESRWTLLVGC
ncbi:hypothetical protein L226DRAFT_258909 [Lentinus tigrinus ALCF2SS1-7]|uniref:Uncharacterized protein n=1 Tax=Lentinus tigrinus ALCF2SS1-6 TaxID=1328759 RepID=A0A5C2RLD0_9APHY|nr:hypothetical protein L227DRAFT_52392 [Lentinus tigrinus ALCF2SS1-6]RPD69974.1 hypothetical protein L226DRAFT_258909 [Lentinus tigrinus ALCF2SS1-7]